MSQVVNKQIQRAPSTSKLFDDRSLEKDYATLITLLKPNMQVLDIGCGTGAISKGIAKMVQPQGHVTAIDNTEHFIISGKETYGDVENLELLHTDLFEFKTHKKFDLITAARTLQWLNNPEQALAKMKSLLKPGGWLSVLDYDHNAIEWQPEPPVSMQVFYAAFLKWRKDAGMNNRVAEDAAGYFKGVGIQNIEVHNAEETYKKGEENFINKISIWSKVAQSTQMVDEGYITNHDRLQAIEDYDNWIATDAEQMVMKLKETRGYI
ncbi:class I SAM-dependent methyltransferase [Mucilaginibacter antarcticus]|uniref:Class I SAM-dependent methyltransferase n=1 Tax=Mucilaginibacter antarcticus TaxID=1855725 RepID=A0ABW5XQX9_9SPHI